MILTKLDVSYFKLSVDFLLTETVARFPPEQANSLDIIFHVAGSRPKGNGSSNACFGSIGESARERLSDVDRLSHYQEEPSDEKNYRHERDRNEAQNTVPND